MEINISALVKEERLTDYFASVAEKGPHAAIDTWNAALGSRITLVSLPEEIHTAKDYLRCFGCWSQEEIDTWSDGEVNALVIQLVSGDLREYIEAKEQGEEEFKNWEERYGGRIYEHEGDYYYYLGE